MLSILVIGGNGTFGSSIVDSFLEEGHLIKSTYHNPENRRILPHENYSEIFLDLTSATLREELSFFTEIDVVIVASGLLSLALMGKIEDEDIRESIEVNLISNIKICNYFLPVMLKNGFGRIVIIGSTIADQGSEGGSVYAASKAGLRGLLYSASREIKLIKEKKELVADVTINLIEPGPVRGNMLKSFDNEFFENFISNTPTKQLTSPIEIADTIKLLVKDNSNFNGSVLKIDGGLRM